MKEKCKSNIEKHSCNNCIQWNEKSGIQTASTINKNNRTLAKYAENSEEEWRGLVKVVLQWRERMVRMMDGMDYVCMVWMNSLECVFGTTYKKIHNLLLVRRVLLTN